MRRVHIFRALFFTLLVLIVAGVSGNYPSPVWAVPLDEAVEQVTPPVDPEQPAPRVEPLRRHVFTGNVNNHPKLDTASKEIDLRVNRSLRAIAPGFSDVRTFSDQRDDFGLWTPFIGVGMNLGDHWDVFAQMGYTRGKIRTKATDLSLLLLPLRTDVEFERSSFYAGIGAAWYPWGLARPGEYHGMRERLAAARPFVATTLNWNYLTFDGSVKARFLPFRDGITIRQDKDWKDLGLGVNVGVDIPMTKRGVLAANVQYNEFLNYSEDFSGPAFSVYWKHYF